MAGMNSRTVHGHSLAVGTLIEVRGVRTTEDELPDLSRAGKLAHEREREAAKGRAGVDGGRERDEARDLVAQVGAHAAREGQVHCELDVGGRSRRHEGGAERTGAAALRVSDVGRLSERAECQCASDRRARRASAP